MQPGKNASLAAPMDRYWMNTWGLVCTVPLQPFYVSLGISILEPFHTGGMRREPYRPLKKPESHSPQRNNRQKTPRFFPSKKFPCLRGLHLEQHGARGMICTLPSLSLAPFNSCLVSILRPRPSSVFSLVHQTAAQPPCNTHHLHSPSSSRCHSILPLHLRWSLVCPP